jgi:hypothetical protein
MRRVSESSARGGKSADQILQLIEILALMEQALELLDRVQGPAHVAAQLQTAIDQLQDEIGLMPSSSESREH